MLLLLSLLFILPSHQLASVGFIVVGRNDTDISNYNSLSNGIGLSLKKNFGIASMVSLIQDTKSIPGIVQNFNAQGIKSIFLVAHSMTTGGIIAQNYIQANPNTFNSLILLSSFLQRTQRPDVVSCLKKSSIQPVVSLHYPLGYLQDGVHDCYGPNIPGFPISTLTISGELDGVVRVTRIAEAYYTQIVLGKLSQQHPVVVVTGMNHGNLLNTNRLPASVTNLDLKAEISNDQAISQVSDIISFFVAQKLGVSDGGRLANLVKSTGNYFSVIFSAFVNMEGNWFFTGGDDEHGSSSWAAQAQVTMAEPLASKYSWTPNNNFHLLSDEDMIPPYYRPKHRPDATISGSSISSTTVSQLRFIQVSLIDVDGGLNGRAVIREEKLNILSVIPDDGSSYVSSLEIGTKLMSRQNYFNRTGQPAPNSLDDGNRCASINQLAYNWAEQNLPTPSFNRWKKYGLPFVMGDDVKPFPAIGPTWIWTYMTYNKNSQFVSIQSPFAFYPLDANPYGAGNHYCKLLSPARALEWMLIDGLRDGMKRGNQ